MLGDYKDGFCTMYEAEMECAGVASPMTFGQAATLELLASKCAPIDGISVLSLSDKYNWFVTTNHETKVTTVKWRVKDRRHCDES